MYERLSRFYSALRLLRTSLPSERSVFTGAIRDRGTSSTFRTYQTSSRFFLLARSTLLFSPRRATRVRGSDQGHKEPIDDTQPSVQSDVTDIPSDHQMNRLYLAALIYRGRRSDSGTLSPRCVHCLFKQIILLPSLVPECFCFLAFERSIVNGVPSRW